MYRITMNVEL